MTLADDIRRDGTELRAVRAGYAVAALAAEHYFAHHADAHVALTPRTMLHLRAGRLYLHRPPHEALRLSDAALLEPADVPSRILLLAAQHLRDLVDPEAP